MSPKGGIRPHNRFSIQAKRSEVLFVDYIAEHLNPSGKAAVIVPEGIIFQSQNAYKALRKMLVENYLWAVVSLPAGVFNPYSGVKTSILFMDKSLAKRIDKILFVKIESDGFDLGAQRRPIDKNDLPAALEYIKQYKSQIASPKSKIEEIDFAYAVTKKKIAKSGDYNLTGDRYRIFEHHTSNQWPMIELGSVCEQERKQISPDSPEAKSLPYIGLEHIESDSGEILKKSIDESDNEIKSLTFAFDDRHILYGKLRPYLNKVALPDFAGRCSTEIIPLIPIKINRKLLAFILRREETSNFVMQNKTGTRMPRADIDLLLTFNIPLPPLEVQEKIVAEIEGYQKIIDAARQIVENYKPTIKINPAWPMVKIGEICNLVRGSSPRPKSDKRFYGGSVPRLMVSDLTRDGMYVEPKTDSLTEEGAKLSRPMRKGDVVMAVSGNPGLPAILKTDACIHDGFVGFKDLNKTLMPEFFYFVLLHLKDANNSQSVGAVFLNLTTDQIKEFTIPKPTMAEQKQIVEQIEAEQKIVNENKKLAEIFEQKIKDTISEIWSK
jgi:type I restriction enzyme M protein